MVRLSEIKLVQQEDRPIAGGRSPTNHVALCTFYPQYEHGGLLGLGQGCHHLPATSQSVGKGDIQQHLSSIDTTSTLVSDTLASRAVPPH